MSTSSLRSILALSLLVATPAAWAQGVIVGRLTTSVTDQQFNAGARDPALSADGGYILFVSSSSNLGLASNGSLNVYLYELATDRYFLGMQLLGNGNSFAPTVASGGGALAFESLATNLPGTGGGQTDVYYSEAFDAGQGEIAFNTYLVSRGLGGAPPNGESRYASISADAQFVAYRSEASNLIAGDTNNWQDIFVGASINFFASAPERVSVDNAGAQINGPSRALSSQAISSDGRYVAFAVDTPVSIDGSNPGTLEDVFVRDRTLGTTSLMSRASTGVAGTSSSDMAAISPNARYVAFRSFSNNLVPSPTGSRIYLRDRQTGTTTNMPLPAGAASCEDPHVSDVADIIAQCNMSAGAAQAFLYRPAGGGAFYRLSTSITAGNGNNTSGNQNGISADGNFSVFDSAASDLVPNDTNNGTDVFVAVDAAVLNQLFADGFEG